jgi:hypothetical protein
MNFSSEEKFMVTNLTALLQKAPLLCYALHNQAQGKLIKINHTFASFLRYPGSPPLQIFFPAVFHSLDKHLPIKIICATRSNTMKFAAINK